MIGGKRRLVKSMCAVLSALLTSTATATTSKLDSTWRGSRTRGRTLQTMEASRSRTWHTVRNLLLKEVSLNFFTFHLWFRVQLWKSWLIYERFWHRNIFFAAQWVSENKEESPLPGFESMTPRQMFWVSWGQVWCAKYRDAALKKQGGNTQRYFSNFKINL